MRMDMTQGVLNTDERGAGIVNVRQRIEQRIEPKENEVLKSIRKIWEIPTTKLLGVDRRIKSAMENVDGVLQHVIANTETMEQINTASKVEKRKTSNKKKDPWLKR